MIMQDVEHHAQRILAQSAHSDLHIVSVEELKAGKVYRAEVEALARHGTGSPVSVIIKIADTASGSVPDARSPHANPAHDILSEWAGLEFLQGSGTPPGLTPLLYGGLADPCMIVMEDFGTLPSVADLLTSGTSEESATSALRGRAVALAHLQGATYGQEDRYRALRGALGPTPTQRNWQWFGTLPATQGWTDISTLARPFAEGLASIGQDCPISLQDDVRALARALEDPSRRAFVQSDSCPENTLLEGDSAHLIDVERGGFHSLGMDIVFARMGMPHCFWAGRVPTAVVHAIEQDYRATLSRYRPELGDEERFGQQIVEACGYWLLGSGAWLLTPRRREDFTWGNSTWRRRVLHRLNGFAEASAEYSHLEAMAEAARESYQRLTDLWGSQGLALFPPFAGAEG